MEKQIKGIYVLGIGGSSFQRIELAKACGYEILGLFHYNNDRTGQVDHGYTIIGSFEDMFAEDIRGKYFLLTMGDMNIRKELFHRIVSAGGMVPTLIHPTAEISEFATISSDGVIIDSQVIVQSDCKVEEGAFICSQSMICHQTTIEPYVFVAPKSLIGARLRVKQFAFIGQNATIISTKVKEIGANSTVGAGAVVTKPVLDGQVVVGNPAKALSNKIL